MIITNGFGNPDPTQKAGSGFKRKPQNTTDYEMVEGDLTEVSVDNSVPEDLNYATGKIKSYFL